MPSPETAGTFQGSLRKQIMMGATAVGVVLCGCCLLVPAFWWLGVVLLVLINVAFGLAYAMYSAHLPVLAAAHPETLAVAAGVSAAGGPSPSSPPSAAERTETYERVLSRMSSRG